MKKLTTEKMEKIEGGNIIGDAICAGYAVGFLGSYMGCNCPEARILLDIYNEGTGCNI